MRHHRLDTPHSLLAGIAVAVLLATSCASSSRPSVNVTSSADTTASPTASTTKTDAAVSDTRAILPESTDPPSATEDADHARGDRDTVPLIIDTDMGYDDIRALMLVLLHPRTEVLAISVTGTGLGRCPESAHNAAAIVDALGLAPVPIGCGTSRPLEGFNTMPTAFRDTAVELAGMQLERAGGAVPDAVEVMAAALDEHSQPITVLALGPLTNVAQLLRDPASASAIGEIRSMGGAIDVGGNIISFSNTSSEFNMWLDPVAAGEVLASGVPITMIPLDATNAVPVTPAFDQVLGDAPTTTAAQLLRDHRLTVPSFGGIYHWDDLAAATLIEESIVDFEEMEITVDTDLASDSAGRTARAALNDGNGTPVRVAIRADRAAFERLFYETITGTPSTTDGRWQPDATIEFDGDGCVYEGPDVIRDGLHVMIENSSDESGFGTIFGTYADDAIRADLDAMLKSDTIAPPTFMTIHALAAMPAKTVGYWTAVGANERSTIWCAVNDDVIEVAGPRLQQTGPAVVPTSDG